MAALTAVEIALWDLAGKALGLPIYQLMGGKMRDRIRIYCDSGTDSRNDPQAKAFIAQIVDNGFTMAKIDIDDARDPARFDRVNWTANNAEIDHMVDKVAFMRESLPKTIELAVDMHGRYDLGTAKRVAKETGAVQAGVARRAGSAREHRRHARRARIDPHAHLLRREPVPAPRFPGAAGKAAVDIIMPDFQKCGGLLEARKIADMAHTYYVPMAPHCQASPIGFMASCHVMAAIPNALVQEWHWGHPAARTARWKQYVKEGDIIQKGFVTVTDRPGIGVEMNEEAVRKMVRPGSPWFGA